MKNMKFKKRFRTVYFCPKHISILYMRAILYENRLMTCCTIYDKNCAVRKSETYFF